MPVDLKAALADLPPARYTPPPPPAPVQSRADSARVARWQDVCERLDRLAESMERTAAALERFVAAYERAAD